MKNVNYDNILSYYQRKRIDNMNETDRRRAEVYAAIPRIREIDEEIASSSLSLARKRILSKSSSDSDKDDVHRHNRELLTEKKVLLKNSAFAEDYLDPIYECKLCRDTGYVDNHPCSCMRQKIINEQYEQSTIGKILSKENFDTFSLGYYSNEGDGIHSNTPYENAANILKKCKSIVDNFDTRKNGILIYGNTGTGKTFLSNCMAKALLDKGYTVLYLSSIELFDNTLSEVIINNNRSSENRDRYNYIFNCDFLIIDDLGTECTNSFVQSQLFEIIKNRYNKGLSTMISTNLTIRQMQERYTDRILSRIVDSFSVFNLYGDDIRHIKRKNLV